MGKKEHKTMHKRYLTKEEIENRRDAVVDEIADLALNRFAGLRKYEIEERKRMAELFLKLNWLDEI